MAIEAPKTPQIDEDAPTEGVSCPNAEVMLPPNPLSKYIIIIFFIPKFYSIDEQNITKDQLFKSICTSPA